MNKDILKKFDKFKIKEYGKWKIGRVEAKQFLLKALSQQRDEIIEMIDNFKKEVDKKAKGDEEIIRRKFWEMISDGLNESIKIIKTLK